MPYGANKYRGRGGNTSARNTSTLARQKAARSKKYTTTRNKPVKAIYKKMYTAPRTKVGANRSAISVLARQVKSLQLSKIGPYQKNWEMCAITGGLHAWHETQPICFAMNNMFHEAPIYMGVTDSTSFPGHEVPGHIAIQQWEKTSPFSLFPEYSYWAGANDDVADKTRYRPISTKVTVNIECPSLAPNTVYWARIDIIRPTKVLLQSNVHKLTLPFNLQSLSYLASDDMVKRSRINRQYFKIYQTKWLKFTNNSDQNKTIERFCNFRFTFPAGSPTERINAREHVQTVVGQVNENFISNMPPDSIYWMVLSTSHSGSTHNTQSMNLQMSRFISYRDPDGVAS